MLSIPLRLCRRRILGQGGGFGFYQHNEKVLEVFQKMFGDMPASILIILAAKWRIDDWAAKVETGPD